MFTFVIQNFIRTSYNLYKIVKYVYFLIKWIQMFSTYLLMHISVSK